MLISDWSSDVCSSDLGLERKTPGRAKEIDQHRQRAVFEIERAHVEPSRIGRAGQHRAEPRFGLAMVWSLGGILARLADVENAWTAVFWRSGTAALFLLGFLQIGRASCRERVCQYV